MATPDHRSPTPPPLAERADRALLMLLCIAYGLLLALNLLALAVTHPGKWMSSTLLMAGVGLFFVLFPGNRRKLAIPLVLVALLLAYHHHRQTVETHWKFIEQLDKEHEWRLQQARAEQPTTRTTTRPGE